MTVTIKRSALVVVLIGVIWGAFVLGRRLAAHERRAAPGLHGILSADAGENSDYGVGGLALREQESNVPPADIFEQVLDNVQKQYVRSYGGERRLSYGALSQMLASLDDPKTDFLTPEMSKVRQSALMGRCYGIGAALTVTQTKNDDVTLRALTVVSVLPGGPADRCGLKSGDHITEIDHHWVIAYNLGVDVAHSRQVGPADDTVRPADHRSNDRSLKAGYSLGKALELLEAGETKAHELTVARPGRPMPLQMSVTTALTRAESAEFMALGDGIGYLHVRQFNDHAREACVSAVRASDLKGLVVDLRQCSGGVTAAAGTEIDGYAPARELIASLTDGSNVAAIERRPGQRQPLRVSSTEKRLHIPLAVLVDAGTANLAELVAAALHDAGRATLVGTRTFGDDVLQMFAPLKSGGAIEITRAHLFTATGADLASGLRPDVVLSPEGVVGDTAIQRARAIVLARASQNLPARPLP